MAMDLVVIIIVLLSAATATRKGFIKTLVSFGQWFVCVILGFLFYSKVKSLLVDRTHLDEYINSTIVKQLEVNPSDSTPYQTIPELFKGWIEEGTNSLIYQTATSITSIILTIISFLLIVIGIKILCFLLLRMFSKESNEGIIGFMDGFCGFILGLFRGAIIIFLIFAFMVPLLSSISPELSKTIMESFDNSYIAGTLYENNLLLIFLRDLFS